MGLGNLACHPGNQKKIMQEGALPALISIAKYENGDLESQRYAILALTNLSATKANHAMLVDTGCLSIFAAFFDHQDVEIRNSSCFAVANLAANANNHLLIINENCLPKIIELLKVDDTYANLRAVTALRGLSTDANIRVDIVEMNALPDILRLAKSDEVELQMESLACLCNLSLCGCIGDNPLAFLDACNIKNLVSYLCSADATFRLFGAVTLGNIASTIALQDSVVDGGALGPLVTISNQADLETQRCIAYALCNLAADPRRRVDIVREGGLPSLISMACSEDLNDQLAAMSTIRGIASHPEFRRPIFQANVTEALTIGTRANNIEIRCEAAALMCALSINDDNKLEMALNDTLLLNLIDLLKKNYPN